MGTTHKRVAILGAGPAGLAAAFALAKTGQYEIHVYQSGWRAGGKCASGREAGNFRTLQNGSHYLFGCYYNAFALLREAYAVLERSADTSKHKFGSFEREFVARNLLVSSHRYRTRADGSLEHDWYRYLPQNLSVPGEGGKFPTPFDYVLMGVQYAVGFTIDFGFAVLGFDRFEGTRTCLRVLPLSAVETAPWARLVQSLLRPVRCLFDELAWPAARSVFRYAGALGALCSPRAARVRLRRALCALRDRSLAGLDRVIEAALPCSAQLPAVLSRFVQRNLVLADLALAFVAGYFADGLSEPGGFERIDAEEFRSWLTRHGARRESVESALINTWYDAVLCYKDGDPAQPTCSAGVAVQAIARALLTYKGAFAFQMRAEVGDSFIAPLVRALELQGVRFHFFSRVKRVVVDTSRRRVERIVLGIQCSQPPARAQFVEVPDHGTGSTRLTWPAAPSCPECARADPPLDSYYATYEIGERTLYARDLVTATDACEEAFDAVVDALPCAVNADVLVDSRGVSIAAVDAAWRACFEQLRFTESQAIRFWFKWPLQGPDKPPPNLGWGHDSPILSGYAWPHTTWEDNSQARDIHGFPREQQPLTIATVFGPLATAGTDVRSRDHLRRQRQAAQAAAQTFVRRSMLRLWPGLRKADAAADGDAIDWDALIDLENRQGPQRFEWQHIVANVGPSESYVLAEHGKLRYRLRPGGSGFDNLYLAGDWTRNGVEVGSVEGAVISGLKAARALSNAAIEIVGGDDFDRGSLFREG